MTYTEQDLLSRGFVDTSFTDDEGNGIAEYILGDRQLGIEVSGLDFIELVTDRHYREMEIDTLSELDTVIRIFGLNKK